MKMTATKRAATLLGSASGNPSVQEILQYVERREQESPSMRKFANELDACERKISDYLLNGMAVNLPIHIQTLGRLLHAAGKDLASKVEDIRETVIGHLLSDAERLAREGVYDRRRHEPSYVAPWQQALRVATVDIPDHASVRDYGWVEGAQSKLASLYRAQAVVSPSR